MPVLSWVPSRLSLLHSNYSHNLLHPLPATVLPNFFILTLLWREIYEKYCGLSHRLWREQDRVFSTTLFLPLLTFASFFQILWLFIMLSLYFSQNTSMLFSTNYTPYGLKKTCSEAYAEAYFMINTVNCCFPPFSNMQESIVILHLAIT